MSVNPYLPQIHQVLPRLLSLFDDDTTSDSCGMGDRYHWAWGLIDFGNATMQGSAHGLARLWKNGLWPYSTTLHLFLRRIDRMFEATAALARRDGSLEEAFPNEGSYCVTALVAYDLLCALDLLRGDIPETTAQKWTGIVAPLIGFLHTSDETHAFISNHLATAAAALARWHATTGCERSEARAAALLRRILDRQSSEGWFCEYEGADPGYQTLCTYYLADLHTLRPDWRLLEPLERSVGFLNHFAHPDGSFGGLYGSRSTRFYYPAGFEELAPLVPRANALRTFMGRSVASMRTVTLVCMDAPNLAPMFNAYCKAAALHAKTPEDPAPESTLPAFTLRTPRHFPEAGLFVDGGERHYTIVGTNKGGCVVHFRDRKLVRYDGGIVIRRKNGDLGSTQSASAENRVAIDERRIVVKAPVTKMNKRLPSPANFLLLRLLCCTVFRIRSLREWAKRLLVRLLITGKNTWPIENTREILLGEELAINDATILPEGYERVTIPGPFVAIHMASQGYWQIQDEGETP